MRRILLFSITLSLAFSSFAYAAPSGGDSNDLPSCTLEVIGFEVQASMELPSTSAQQTNDRAASMKKDVQDRCSGTVDTLKVMTAAQREDLINSSMDKAMVSMGIISKVGDIAPAGFLPTEKRARQDISTFVSQIPLPTASVAAAAAAAVVAAPVKMTNLQAHEICAESHAQGLHDDFWDLVKTGLKVKLSPKKLDVELDNIISNENRFGQGSICSWALQNVAREKLLPAAPVASNVGTAPPSGSFQ